MLTQEKLKKTLHYNPETGEWTRLHARGARLKGSKVGCMHKQDGYKRIRIKEKLYKASRLAWLFMTGSCPTQMIDHIDQDKVNDKFTNLREITRSENGRNRQAGKNNALKICGVSKGSKGGFRARIQNDHLGLFDTKTAAAMARWKEEVKRNWPNANTTSSSYLYLKQKGLV